MVFLDIKSHVQLFMFNLRIGTFTSSNRTVRYFSIVCCLNYIIFFIFFTIEGIREFINIKGVRRFEQVYELCPGIAICMKMALVFPVRLRLRSLFVTFDEIEWSAEGYTIMLRKMNKFKRFFRFLLRMWLGALFWTVMSGLMKKELPFANEGLPFIDTTVLRIGEWKYWLVAVHQYAFLFYGICVNLFIDGYSALVIALVGGYLEVIAAKVKKIGWLKEEKASREELVKCVDMHQKAFELQQDFTKLFSTTLMVQCAMSTITICAIMVKFSLDSPLQNIGNYIRNIFLMLSILIEISIFNYMGSELVLSNNCLKNALFDTNWVEKDMKFRKMLIMFQQRLQKFIEIRIGYIFVVHLEMVASICNTAHKLYAVLMKVNQ